MNPFMLEMFQREVLLQCGYALRAVRDFESAVRGHNRENDAFYHAQMMLLAYANISKLLWAQSEGDTRDKRLVLRQSLDASDFFQQSERTMRNHYEHFDERLDRWGKQSIPGAVRNIDRNVIPIGMLGTFSRAEKDVLRHFDPHTRDLIFWGDKLNVNDFVAEINRLRNRTMEVLKPLWERGGEGHTKP